MRLPDSLKHPLAHSALTNILTDQHHLNPQNIEVSNTTQQIEPLPGGPGVWDISAPFDTNVLMFDFRTNKPLMLGGAYAGLTGIATSTSIDAVCFSHSGVFAGNSYNAIYAKRGGAVNLSHKMFSSTGIEICLTEAHLYLVDASTKVFRTVWTNYGSGYSTLNVWGQVHIIG